ncbi:hypothetical protein BHE74_00052974 [Ensete ventricosum]|uniref:Uncharacterized protein n=1 Tax=Ensete ventricosum TaxID=4639 RepID=A0A427A7E4_ENSVE|nr:hypothetical protein B296_00019135 [Ensete ventricosum]RWW41537.1 hypothetical protein BHE74_00052974 [Ensete ventricosum]RZS24917.1 hypothetical protein BHM03_00058051 [Ensete ventricosum]
MTEKRFMAGKRHGSEAKVFGRKHVNEWRRGEKGLGGDLASPCSSSLWIGTGGDEARERIMGLTHTSSWFVWREGELGAGVTVS